jgi:serine protease Do
MYRKRLLIPVVSVSFVLLLALGLLLNIVPQETASGEISAGAGHELLESLNAALVEVAATSRASVVNISTTVTVQRGSKRGSQPGDDLWDLWEEFFGRPRRNQPRRQQPEKGPGPRGSGFIVKTDGYILTNNHVIAGADKIRVILDDKREFDAELVGTDRETEVAVIKVDAKNLPAMKLGDSDKLQVGEMVLAIGNPFGLSHTVTNGIVSGTSRSNVLDEVTYQDFIQTDAPINPGNSGGPLVNIRGEVIGINTAIALATTASGMPIRGNVGVGFAIPINMALNVMDQLIEKGKVVRGYLGIQMQLGSISSDMAERYGLDEPAGSLILEVHSDTPAEDAGLKKGDLIIEFNGEIIEDNSHLQKLVAAIAPGETVEVKVIRNRKEKEFKVKLGERPDFTTIGPGGRRETPDSQEEWLGITVQELTEALAQRLGYEDQEGILISSVDPEGSAAEAHDPPKQGDLIQEIELQEIKSMKDYKKAKKEVEDEGKDSVMIRLWRPGRGSWYTVIKK